MLTCICGTLAARQRASTTEAEVTSVGPNMAITPVFNNLHAGNSIYCLLMKI